MSYEVLLGQDFCRNPLIKIELGDNIKIIKRCDSVSESSTDTQIMRIEYLENLVKVEEELNINSDIEACLAGNVRKLYNEEFTPIQASRKPR